MKLTLTIIALGTLVSGSAMAKPKTQSYPASCDRVWQAVKRASVPPHYNFSLWDEANKKGIVSTGNNLSGKRNLDITLTGTGDACTVAVGGMFSGLVHNDKGDLFKRISRELVAPTAPPIPPPGGAARQD
jgi:hypothetical protein